MRTYRITSEADTRSKTRKIRHWTIEAANEDDACYEARMRHLRIVGWNSSIACDWEVTDG
jgi:hypothetical protein